MKKLYSLLYAALIAVAAMAQTPAKEGGQQMPINSADPVKFYTNEAYSWEGHYDYYFSFSNTDDQFFFPKIVFDLYLPTNEGLVEGSYKMSEGTVDENLMMIANYNDYIYYYYGYASYEWADATVRLTKGEGEDVWTVDFSATTVDGYTYTFSYTGEFPVEEDDFDPNASVDPDQPEVEYTYDYEPDAAQKYDLTFQTPDCSDMYVDEYNLYDIILEHTDVLDNGRFFEGRLYLVTTEHQPHAGIYPVDDSGEQGTFLASQGCPEGSSKDTPCFFRTADDMYVYDSWYIMSGQISLNYNAAGEMVLEGDVVTYKGSEFHFTTANSTDGINTVLADSSTGSGQSLSPTKFIRDGRVYINGGRFLYNTEGKKVKK